MNVVADRRRESRGEQRPDRGLYAPRLQPHPLPLRRIAPAPCGQACPAGINVKAYVSLVAQERFDQALEVVRRHCPLPGVCGRVCHHPCEAACLRGRHDEPVAIRALKRFIADYGREHPPREARLPPARGRPVAIVGSGPAGLTAAHDLRLAGFPVTMFEAATSLGGMLRQGIAAYRLPRDVLDEEIDAILRCGVDVRTGVRVGLDLELAQLRADGFAAVLLATGAPHGRRLGVGGDGDRVDGLEDALAFLRRVNAGDRQALGRRVLVVGGGSTAVEAARCAKRLGARSVVILYRRSREQLLASAEEVEAAEREGVQFRFLMSPCGVHYEGDRLGGLRCREVALGPHDASGRRRPIPIPGSEKVVAADHVLAAVGQETDLSLLPSRQRNEYLESGRLVVDPGTLMTRLGGVFAAGDFASGPATVIEAIAAGHRAALGIRRLLGDDVAADPAILPVEYESPGAPPAVVSRMDPREIVPVRGREFDEVERGYRPAEAIAEARRCLRCGPCSECERCAPDCTWRHLALRASVDAAGASSPPTLVRVAPAVSMALDPSEATGAWLLSDGGTPPAMTALEAWPAAEVLPARVHVEPTRCRGCPRCIEVCGFDAVSMAAGPAPGSQVATVDPARCRGCNLCAAVCPTGAIVSPVFPLRWWQGHLLAAEAKQRRRVVFACHRRVGELPAALKQESEVIAMRCVGGLDAGSLLEVATAGYQVVVTLCGAAGCRFGEGSAIALREVIRARGILEGMGLGALEAVGVPLPNAAGGDAAGGCGPAKREAAHG